MRRSILLCVVVALFLSLGFAGNPWSPRVVAKIQNHAVAVVVYYTMSDAMLRERVTEIQKGGAGGAAIAVVKAGEGQALAYMGSGTLLPDDYVLTVRHLLAHGKPGSKRTVWVMHPKIGRPLEAEVVAMTTGDESDYDYGMLRLKERLGFPGVKVAKSSPAMGEEVAYGGSLRGMAFFLRFGRTTTLNRYFRKDGTGALHLSMFADNPYVCVYPGGPGDSGSGIFNTRGELCGVGYCGLELNGTGYLLSNPMEIIHRFLREAMLERLIPG